MFQRSRFVVKSASMGTEWAVDRQLLKRADRVCGWLRAHIAPNLRPTLQAEDVFQEVAIAAFRSPTTRLLSTDDDWDNWLFGVARVQLAMAKRTLGCPRRRPRGALLHESVFGRLAGNDKTPSRQLSGREAGYAARVALASLPDSCRIVVEMRFLDGLSHLEIAKSLNKSEAAVNSLLYRGLAKLRDRLGSASRYLSGDSGRTQQGAD